MQIDSTEISEFVRAVLYGIDNAISTEYAVTTAVKFKIGIRSRVDKKGNVSLRIVGIGGGDYDKKNPNEEIAHVEFEVDDMVTVTTKKFDDLQKSETGKAFLEYFAKKYAKNLTPTT